MDALLAFIGTDLLPPALHLPTTDPSSSENENENDEAAEGGADDDAPTRSPAPKRRSGGNKRTNKPSTITDPQLALELTAAALTVLADWVVVSPPAAFRVARASEGWATGGLLPAMAGEGEGREGKWAALGLLPQVCRLVYQLALQEAKGVQQVGEVVCCVWGVCVCVCPPHHHPYQSTSPST